MERYETTKNINLAKKALAETIRDPERSGQISLIDFDVSKQNLRASNLKMALCCSTNFSECNLSESDLSDSNLGYANLTHANLFGANLSRANLYRANFCKADLRRANLTDANLSEANFAGAELAFATWRDEEILKILGFSGFGSVGRLTNFLITDKSIKVFCGCFTGDIEEFKSRIRELGTEEDFKKLTSALGAPFQRRRFEYEQMIIIVESVFFS